MAQKERLWRKRGHVEWLKSGNLNTKYFHSRASQRNKRNFISKLLLDDGTVEEDKAKIGLVFVEYYRNIFTSSNPFDFEPILRGVEPKIMIEMNASLTREFIAEEVELALKQMKSLTAPGPNGMPPLFYKS